MAESPEIHVFCQAVGDIKYALTLYERHKAASRVVIHVVNAVQSMQFLERLGLPEGVLHRIEYPAGSLRMRRPLHAWAVRRALDGIYRCHFATLCGATVYFFSEVIDLATCSLVVRLARRNRIVHWQHYVYRPAIVHLRGLRGRAHLWLTRWVHRMPVESCRLGESVKHSRQLLLPLARCGIPTEPAQGDPGVLATYAYQPPCDPARSVLLIDSPCERSDDRTLDHQRYEEFLDAVLSACDEAGWPVVLKPHPRITPSKRYAGRVAAEVPNDVPADFLPVGRFGIVMGFFSSALATAAQHRGERGVVALLHLLPWRAEGDRAYAESIVQNTTGRVLMPRSLDDVERLLGRSGDVAEDSQNE